MAAQPLNVPDDLVVDFDIHAPALRGPGNVFQEKASELRAKGPVVYSTAHGGHWIITRYREIQDVLRDNETFSSYPNDIAGASGGRMIPIELDQPDHLFYRQALQPLFSPKRMKELQTDIRDVVGDLLDGFITEGSCEFVEAFAHELPTRVFLALMGWPLDDAPMIGHAADVVVAGVPGKTMEESAEARMEAAFQLLGYFSDSVAKLRENPDDTTTLTAQIVNTPIEMPDGVRLLQPEELCQMFLLLAIAGLHTTQGSLSWSIVHLANNPGQRERLVKDMDLVPQAVEEILRFEAAISAGRRATRDTEIAGVKISAEDQLILFLCTANRDEAEFDLPDIFDIERFPNRHLSFGSGAHRCIGSHLARIELQIALEEIHKRAPDYQLVPEDPPIFYGSQVRGCVRLPITFTPGQVRQRESLAI